MPGSDHGIPDWAPTLGDVLKEEGYNTGQFGKNHLGDQDKHLPTVHGFDEFFGNLYHLNAEEEPENLLLSKRILSSANASAPRGVIRSSADGTVEDTGPMTRKRMETADEEFVGAALDFIDRSVSEEKPFFAWVTTTRMHVWTRLKPEAQGVTGIGLYPDGMVEHDGHVGLLLGKLDELDIADNTIVVYSTDNGAESFTWPDGGITPFHGEKGTTWEGGMRVPQFVRWPGVIEPGSIVNEIMSHEDWMPTLAAAAGNDQLVERMKEGTTVNGKEWRVHLDGYNFLPFFQGETDEGPRDEYLYFDQQGNLNAVRFRDWKINFAGIYGNIASGMRFSTNWPMVVNLKADPYEEMPWEGEMGYLRWYADNMWLFVPIQQVVQEFLGTIPDYPFQTGASLNAAGINYNSLRAMDALERFENLEELMPPIRN